MFELNRAEVGNGCITIDIEKQQEVATFVGEVGAITLGAVRKRDFCLYRFEGEWLAFDMKHLEWIFAW